MPTVLNERAVADVMAAMTMLPETFFEPDDDRCDCTFQRIYFTTNPYLGATLEVRMCCIWAELYKLFPQFARETPAFKDYRIDEWDTGGPWEWNGETPMPRALWYRQLARQTGKSLPEIRAEYGHLEPPQGIPRAPVPAARKKRWWQR